MQQQEHRSPVAPAAGEIEQAPQELDEQDLLGNQEIQSRMTGGDAAEGGGGILDAFAAALGAGADLVAKGAGAVKDLVSEGGAKAKSLFSSLAKGATKAIGEVTGKGPKGAGDVGGFSGNVALTPEELEKQQATIDWLNSKGSAPAQLPEFEGQARGAVAQLDARQREACTANGLSEDDLVAVAFYTTNAAYAMNAVLRGQIKDPAWVAAFQPWAVAAARALPKMPGGARNKQGDHLIDGSKGADAHIDFDEVYRADYWSSHFTPVFAKDFKIDRVLDEPGFLSTTLVKGSYGADAPVQRTLTNAGAGRSISDVSVFKSENEALYAPGTKMQIDDIVDKETGATVEDPGAAFSNEELEARKFDVEVRILQVGRSDSAPKADPESEAPGPDPLQPAVERAQRLS